MELCRYCLSKQLIKKGKRGIVQRYYCKTCKKFQQGFYNYSLYNINDDLKIKQLHAEGLGIRSLSRFLGYSPSTIIRKIRFLATKVTKPIYQQNNQIYEVDEMWTYIGNNKPSNYCWITYAINRETYDVMDLVVGSRSKMNIEKVIDSVKMHNPRMIITDKLPVYSKLVDPFKHCTKRYSNNHIERGNLTLRTHMKRLNRKTICFSKSKKMLEASLLLYFDWHDWKLRMG